MNSWNSKSGRTASMALIVMRNAEKALTSYHDQDLMNSVANVIAELEEMCDDIGATTLLRKGLELELETEQHDGYTTNRTIHVDLLQKRTTGQLLVRWVETQSDSEETTWHELWLPEDHNNPPVAASTLIDASTARTGTVLGELVGQGVLAQQGFSAGLTGDPENPKAVLLTHYDVVMSDVMSNDGSMVANNATQ